jgi:dTDP-4-dehydrorhamnose reductase
VDLLAEVTLDLINLATPGFGSASPTPIASGIYHCAPAGVTDWFDYARLIINTAKHLGAAKACERIAPIPTQDYPTAARRPLNSRLDTRKLQGALGRELPPWQDDVIRTVREQILSEENADF